MSLRCAIGYHLWNGCRCTVCGMLRDRGHQKEGCLCAVCGKALHELETADTAMTDMYTAGAYMHCISQITRVCRCCGFTQIEVHDDALRIDTGASSCESTFFTEEEREKAQK